MIPFFVFVLIILFFVRVYFFDLVKRQNSKTNIIGSLFRRYFSFEYLLPLELEDNDSETIVKNKKSGNKALYAFYILLGLMILIIVFAPQSWL